MSPVGSPSASGAQIQAHSHVQLVVSDLPESAGTGNEAATSAVAADSEQSAVQAEMAAAFSDCSHDMSLITAAADAPSADAPMIPAGAVAGHAGAVQGELAVTSALTCEGALPADALPTSSVEVSLLKALVAKPLIPGSNVAWLQAAPAAVEVMSEQGPAAGYEEQQSATAQPVADLPASGSKPKHPLMAGMLQAGGDSPRQACAVSSNVSAGALTEQQPFGPSSEGGSLQAKPDAAAVADAVPDAKAANSSASTLSVVPAPSSPPLATFPVQQLQAVLSGGLNSMCHRLHTAAQREGALR
jgi:hypothetical protein